jgi:hypothetical protein
MSTVQGLLDTIEHQRNIIEAVREYAISSDDHIRKDLLEILEGDA